MKMNVFNFTLMIVLLAGFFNNATAQQTARERLNQNTATEVGNNRTTMSVRATQASRKQGIDIENAKWSRTIYRYLDLSKEANSPLYYPVLPEDGRMNLFSMIFKLLSEDKILAYEYLDGREVFNSEYKVDFVDFLDRFGVYYERDNDRVLVEDVDVPSNEVQGYFVKEIYYFDSSSDFRTRVEAICPIIHRQDDYDINTVRYPLFWIKYSDFVPYALSMPIMASNINNSMTGTIDDFFSKHSYDGEIYKAANPRNLTISQYATTPEDVAMEQQKIELQLSEFEKGLWRESIDSTKIEIKGKRSKLRTKAPKMTNTTSGGSSMRGRRY